MTIQKKKKIYNLESQQKNAEKKKKNIYLTLYNVLYNLLNITFLKIFNAA